MALTRSSRLKSSHSKPIHGEEFKASILGSPWKDTQGVFWNGALHWLGKQENSCFEHLRKLLVQLWQATS
ncbi:hypothetical protein OIU79_027248 [Salix purpurea]|uniref:Uncharacterized protein n=1 Tax=Salix purpurea TaxID=77065 RepID=A0A9Q0VVR5_SALPP|nr:hypothetical protein OIU79_027248 [Salix purpurea]